MPSHILGRGGMGDSKLLSPLVSRHLWWPRTTDLAAKAVASSTTLTHEYDAMGGEELRVQGQTKSHLPSFALPGQKQGVPCQKDGRDSAVAVGNKKVRRLLQLIMTTCCRLFPVVKDSRMSWSS